MSFRHSTVCGMFCLIHEPWPYDNTANSLNRNAIGGQ
jgi:hypothetical protein